MAEAGTVAAVRIRIRAGGAFQGAGSGNEEEVPQVRNTGAAKMREAKAHDGGLVVFVAGRHIVVKVVRIGANLDASERNLRTGIDIAEAVSADKRIDVTDEALLRKSGGAGQQGQG